MAQRKPAGKSTKKSSANSASTGLTDEERFAIREHVQELKASKRPSASKADGESDVLKKIAAMAEPDRAIGERIHAIIKANAPSLSPKTWYGMPAYANANGNVVCFFQDAGKFKTRYLTLGFTDKAHLDDGPMWPTSFALAKLTPAEEAKIAALVKKAAS